MNRAVTAILFGAGQRGESVYGRYALAHPDELQFVAVADPDPVRRRRFAADHNIPEERQYISWEDALDGKKNADAVINSTQDRMHYASSMAAMAAGYDILLEKPMSDNMLHSVHLVQAAETYGCQMQICHVLRYSPFFSALHDIVQSGRLGDVITVEHRENVSYWHMAHAFVRGNWRNQAQSSPMILAKCCHDLDILHWTLGQRCRRLQSFGSLHHFLPENAPEGAPARCTDGCPVQEACPYDAERLYLDMSSEEWPVSVISSTGDLSYEGRKHALQTGMYGRCVYACDNDVVDNQTVNMEFDQGASVVLFMHGHAHEGSRTMRYDGTKATLRGAFYEDRNSVIEIIDHLSGQRWESVFPSSTDSGHGGGDLGAIRNFIRALRGEADVLTNPRSSVESHLMAFAAEESRLHNTVIDMEVFRKQAEMATEELNRL